MKARLLAPLAFATALVAGPVSAATVITPDSSWDGLTSVTRDGITFTGFRQPNTPQRFVFNSQYGLSGVGIEGGRTPTEVDVDERIDAAFTTKTAFAPIASLNIGLLYNGREFLDQDEVLQITGYSGNTVIQYTFTANGDTTGFFTGAPGGVTYTNLQAATEFTGGEWRINNPFGNLLVDRFSLTALDSALCVGGASCPNNSDFILTQVALVPEPSEYAMMGAGLLAVGFIVRRRRRQQAA